MTYKLVGQWDLVELHLVDAGRGRAQHRSCGSEEGTLHDCVGNVLLEFLNSTIKFDIYYRRG